MRVGVRSQFLAALLLLICPACCTWAADGNCPADAVPASGGEHRYSKAPDGPYCEGLVKADHGASLQIMGLMSLGQVSNGSRFLSVKATDTSGAHRTVRIRGSAFAAGRSYQVDAVIEGARTLDINLEQTIRPVGVAVQSIIFVGTIPDAAFETLIPVEVGNFSSQPVSRKYGLYVRVPDSVSKLWIQFNVVGGVSEKREIDLSRKVDGLAFAEIEAEKPGEYSLVLTAKLADDAAENSGGFSLVISRRVLMH